MLRVLRRLKSYDFSYVGSLEPTINQNDRMTSVPRVNWFLSLKSS